MVWSLHGCTWVYVCLCVRGTCMVNVSLCVCKRERCVEVSAWREWYRCVVSCRTSCVCMCVPTWYGHSRVNLLYNSGGTRPQAGSLATLGKGRSPLPPSPPPPHTLPVRINESTGNRSRKSRAKRRRHYCIHKNLGAPFRTELELQLEYGGESATFSQAQNSASPHLNLG